MSIFYRNIANYDFQVYWSKPKHKPKHKLEKWFIISGDGVRTYVQNTMIKEFNHFLS